MSLTPEQITKTALAALTTEDYVLGRNFSATQEAELADLLDKWDAVKDKYSHLNGKIAGYVTETGKKRIAARDDIRQLIGLPRNAAELESVSIGANSTTAVSSSNWTSIFEF